jgi:hypothetical protein
MNPEATFPLARLGISYAKSGNKAAATKVLQDMEKLAKVSYVSPIFIGLVYDALGERAKEFACSAKGYDDRAEWLLWLNLDPLFDEVRGDPRFQGLIRRVGVTG